jgi:hypothetical protein
MLIRLLLKGEALSASQSDSGSVKLARRRRLNRKTVSRRGKRAQAIDHRVIDDSALEK